jgi:NADH dehydrogenase/NADH:ubiquinone oxidoreductase subunit G
MVFLSHVLIRNTHNHIYPAIMAKTMTLDTSRIVKLLAAQFDFDPSEGMRLVAASTSRTDRTDRTDFLAELAIAESNDEAALAKAKMTPAAKKEAAAAKKAEREAKKAAKEAKPKRAPTGYLMFCKEMRPDVKAALEDLLQEGEKLAPTDTVKELAAQWKSLTDLERGEWNKKAADNKEAMKSGTSSEGASSSDESHDEPVVIVSPDVPPPVPLPVPEPPTARKSKAKKPTKEKKLKTVDENKDGDSSD